MPPMPSVARCAHGHRRCAVPAPRGRTSRPAPISPPPVAVVRSSALTSAAVGAVLVLAWLALSGPVAAPPPVDAPAATVDDGYPRTVALPGGASITLARRPERVVPGAAGSADVVCALLPPGRVAALPGQALRYSGVRDPESPYLALPQFHVYEAEPILSHRPDLVLAHPWQVGETTLRLQEAGVCVRTVYPAQVIGPRDPELSEGNQGLKMLLEPLRVVPSGGGMQAVDVRDLAAIHVALLEAAPKPGRYVAAGHLLGWEQVCDLLERLTGVATPRVAIDGRLVRWLGWLGDELQRWVDLDVPLTAEAMEYASLWPGADSSDTLAELGVSFRPLEETFEDTLRWLHQAGHVDAKRVGRLATGRP